MLNKDLRTAEREVFLSRRNATQEEEQHLHSCSFLECTLMQSIFDMGILLIKYCICRGYLVYKRLKSPTMQMYERTYVRMQREREREREL